MQYNCRVILHRGMGVQYTNISEMHNQLKVFADELSLEEKAPKTISKYCRDILKFIDFIGNQAADISKLDVIRFKKYLCSGIYKTSSINSFIIAVNKYLKWLGQPDMTVKMIKQQRKSNLEDVISLELADILGHNSLETTRIYTRSTIMEKRNKLDRLKF